MAEEDTDNIIAFYNKVFVPAMSNEIIQSKERGAGMAASQRTRSSNVATKTSSRVFQNSNVDVLKSPLKMLATTPFTFYQKASLGAKNLGSPVSNMLKLAPEQPVAPVKSKKVLNLDSKICFSRKNAPLKVKEGKTEGGFDHQAIRNINEKLQKFF